MASEALGDKQSAAGATELPEWMKNPPPYAVPAANGMSNDPTVLHMPLHESYARILNQQQPMVHHQFHAPALRPAMYSPAYAEHPQQIPSNAASRLAYSPRVSALQATPQPRVYRGGDSYDNLTEGALYFTLKSTRRFAVQPVGGESKMGRVAKSILCQSMKRWKKSSCKRDLGGGEVEYVFSIRRYSTLLQAFAEAKLRYSELPEEVVRAISLGQSVGPKGSKQLQKGEDLRQSVRELGPSVPERLLHDLAHFQLEGVKFCLEDPRNGVALIADDMGLGKTIQAIACASAYVDEWPMLVMCPTSAKWHWKDEILRWLGKDSSSENPHDSGLEANERKCPERAAQSHGSNMPMKFAGMSEELSWSEEKDVNGSPTKTVRYTRPQLEPHDVFVAEGRNCDIPTFRVLIVSYTLLTSVLENLRNAVFNVIIADECHFLKNADSKRSKAARPLLSKAKRRLLLSGTPALSRPMEMFPQLQLLRPDIWNDRRAFGKRYCTTRRNGALQNLKHDDVGGFKGSGNLSELHACLKATVMLRRRKHVILTQLPPKRRFITRVKASCPAMRALLKTHMEYLRESSQMLGKVARRQHRLKEKMDREKRRKLNPLTDNVDVESKAGDEGVAWPAEHLAGCACNVGKPTLLPDKATLNGGEPMPEEQPNISRNRLMAFFAETARAKLDHIVRLVDSCVEDKLGGKILVFSHHKFVIDCLSNFLRRKIGNGGFIVLDGRTNSRTRHWSIQKFQTEAQCKVGLLSITAAGVGITLTKATHVIFAEMFWTPGALLQAEDRAHRIGQTSVVRVEYLVCDGSLDDVLWPLVRGKCRTLGEMIEGEEAEDDLAHQDRDPADAGSDPGNNTPGNDDVEVINVDAKPSPNGADSSRGDFGTVLKELGREAFAEAFAGSSNGGSFKTDLDGDPEVDPEEFEERMAAIEREEDGDVDEEDSDEEDDEEDNDDDDTPVEIIGSRSAPTTVALPGQALTPQTAHASYYSQHARQQQHPHVAALAHATARRALPARQAMQSAPVAHAVQQKTQAAQPAQAQPASAAKGVPLEMPVIYDLVDDDDED